MILPDFVSSFTGGGCGQTDMCFMMDDWQELVTAMSIWLQFDVRKSNSTKQTLCPGHDIKKCPAVESLN